MIKTITNFLKENRGYQKWGTARLATKFGCSERTVKTCINTLKEKGLWNSNYSA